MLRITPPELLGDLEAVRFRAFGVVRPQVDVDESPAVAVRHLRAEPVHVVVRARDREDRRVEDRRSQQLSRFEIVRDEHAALDAEARGVRGHAVREVPGGGAGEHRKSELDGARCGNRDDAVLVRQRRMVHRVVFHVQLADAEPLREPFAPHERRES
jgi:hypothetical protein